MIVSDFDTTARSALSVNVALKSAPYSGMTIALCYELNQKCIVCEHTDPNEKADYTEEKTTYGSRSKADAGYCING